MSQPGCSCLFIVPGRLDRLTGGSIYDRRVVDHLASLGVRVDVASLPDLSYLAGAIAGLVAGPYLSTQLLARRYDLVITDSWAHTTLFLFALFCRLTRKRRPPVVMIVHQLRSVEIKNGAGRFLAGAVERHALSSVDSIITVSRFMRDRVERFIGSQIHVTIAPPGCDSLEATAPVMEKTARDSSRDPLRLLFVGNCMRRKGLDYLVAALSLLKDVDLKIDVVGSLEYENDYYRDLLRESKRVGVEDKITFHGRVSDSRLSRFYARADLFVMPSLYEGFGIVYAEAMRAGLPIIATDSGPALEIVEAGGNAIVVRAADPAALAGAIRELATDSQKRERFARRSLELAAQLPTWEAMCERVSAVLRQVTGEVNRNK